MKRILSRHFNTVSLLIFFAAILLCFAGAALSQEIDECLECHSDRGLTRTDASGTVHRLYVDKKLFQESIHGKLDYTCMECHKGATLDHPAEGLPDVQCGECHEEPLKKYEMSRHQRTAPSDKSRKPPQCYDCHTMHYNFYQDDRRSSTNPENIPETCGQCHTELVQGPGLLASLVVTRLKGHGKVNLAGDFRIDRCLDCHTEVANHGSKEKEQPVCAKCHEPGNSHLNLGPIHKSEVFSKPPLRIALKVFYGFGLAMVAFAFMSAAGKKYAGPKPEGEENQH